MPSCSSASAAFATATGVPDLAGTSRPAKCVRKAHHALSTPTASSPPANPQQSTISSFRRQLPTALTLARVAAVPMLTTVYLAPPFPRQQLLSASIFALSSITDFLDGFLARRWGVCTRLGAFLDPVADKLIVCAALVCTVSRLSAPGLAPASAIILVREIFVSALREWMAAIGARDEVQVGGIGKVKTAAQMGAVVLLLAAKEPGGKMAVAGAVVLGVSAMLAVVSAVKYLQAALPALTGRDD